MAKSGYRPFDRSAEATDNFDECFRGPGDQFRQHVERIDHARRCLTASRPATMSGRRKRQVFAGRENLRGTEIDILLAAVQAYANVNRDNQIVVYRQQNIAFLQEQFSAARARFDVGESTRTDVSLAEAELAGARASLTAAIAQAKSSAAVYAQIIGSVPKNLKPVALPRKMLPGSLDRAISEGTSEHPTVLAALYGVDAAGYAVKAQEGAPSYRA
jgi:outer membrane protein